MSDNTRKLKYITLNVRGLHDASKRNKVFRWLINNKNDVCFLQETFCTTQFIPYFNSSWRGRIEHAVSDSSHSRGVCIMFSDNNVTVENRKASEDGRILLLNVDIYGKNYTMVNVYANNVEKGRKELFRKVQKWINLYGDYKDNLIIGGDMNCCLRPQDRSSGTHAQDKSRQALNNIVNSFDLNDAWAFTSNEPGFTFIDKTKGTKSRLDYIMVNKSVTLNVTDVGISNCPFVPDHSAVYCILHICNPWTWLLEAQ